MLYKLKRKFFAVMLYTTEKDVRKNVAKIRSSERKFPLVYLAVFCLSFFFFFFAVWFVSRRPNEIREMEKFESP